MRSAIIATGVLATLLLSCSLPVGAQTTSMADAQGWNGAGWYITSMVRPSHAYTLFEGPHLLQSSCVEAYDRLYSPIGICRFLDAKPVAPAR